jgi:acetylglutamate kinase
VGIHVVLVHGGGPQSTELAKALDVPSQFVEGRRVTDERSLQVATMVLNGIINTRVLAICRDIGLPAIGMSGVDAGLIQAHRRPPVELAGAAGGTVDYGFVGDIDGVDSGVLRASSTPASCRSSARCPRTRTASC